MYKTSPEKRVKALQRYYNNREKILEYQKARWKEKYATDPLFKAKRILRDKSRFRSGGLKNLFSEHCAKCGSTKDLHRHHPNYNSIEYIILCRKCHNHTHFP